MPVVEVGEREDELDLEALGQPASGEPALSSRRHGSASSSCRTARWRATELGG